MAVSTQLVSGLSSGLDWRTMIDQLLEVERAPIKLVENKQAEYEDQLSEWQSFNSQLLALKSAATTLRSETAFNVFSPTLTSNTSKSASELMMVSVGGAASEGSYTITVNNVAQSERISSKNYADAGTALGLTGEIVISGKVLTVSSSDTLQGIADNINTLNTGTNPTKVSASIVSYGEDNYHLILASDETGESGISLMEGAYSGGDNILQELGLISSATTIKHATSDGAYSDLFSNSNSPVATMLGLTSAPGATTVQINGSNVDIDLSTQSLTTIAANINALSGVTASVVSETNDDGGTEYRIDIGGTTTFTDNGNVLQSLGILEGTYTEVSEVHAGSVSNTTDGTSAITQFTQWDGIYGANVQAGTSFTITGKDHDGNAVSGSFAISGTTAQVSELINYIQDTVFGGNVTVDINANGQIEITDTTAGDSQLEMTLVTNNVGVGTLDFGTVSMTTEGRNMQLQAGEDAEIAVNNVVISNASNTITDVIEGVTFNVIGEDTSTTMNLKVERNITAIMETMQTFVDAYNEVFSYIYQQQNYDEEDEEVGGILFGDGTLSSVKSDLVNALLEEVWGVDADYDTLSLIGIEFNPLVAGDEYEPQLSINSDTLKSNLETNFSSVKSLFTVTGTTSETALEYISYSRDSEPGEYAVNITQAATQSATTSDTAVGGTLGADETLTITSGVNTAEVSLTSAMTITDIVNAVNSELESIHTETRVGDVANTAASVAITSSTTWDSIDGTTLANTDDITFSGTTRKGTSVSGSYTINDISTDTVQGLLSAIEEAFENDVTTYIDASGRLAIADKFEGSSHLTLEISGPDGKGLDFGTIDVTSGAGDGSKEGRYAMELTASNNGSDQLTISHDTYGSDHSFTVSETADLLWTGGDVTADNGLDVVGTINGEAATGLGQILTGDDDETNIDGLVVKYTGTTTGDIGTVTLTVGIGELFERVLYSIVDPYKKGYVAYKQDSLETRIDDLEQQIEQMQARLDRKMEIMINQFVKMEVTLSAIQSQSQWLAGQINALG
jgi:flagellar hook-associated protein 2